MDIKKQFIADIICLLFRYSQQLLQQINIFHQMIDIRNYMLTHPVFLKYIWSSWKPIRGCIRHSMLYFPICMAVPQKIIMYQQSIYIRYSMSLFLCYLQSVCILRKKRIYRRYFMLYFPLLMIDPLANSLLITYILQAFYASPFFVLYKEFGLVNKQRREIQQTLYVRFFTIHGIAFRRMIFTNKGYIAAILCQLILCYLYRLLDGM